MNQLRQKLVPIALVYLHVAVGLEFLMKGIPKISNPASADRLAAGIHFPTFMGWFPTVLEPVGGALLILGLGTRWLSLYFMAEMIVTGVISKMIVRGVPFAMPPGQSGSGWELDMLVFGGAFILVLFGAGPLSLDHLLARLRGGMSRSTPDVALAGVSTG